MFLAKLEGLVNLTDPRDIVSSMFQISVRSRLRNLFHTLYNFRIFIFITFARVVHQPSVDISVR
jgi:hypothetical protein